MKHKDEAQEKKKKKSEKRQEEETTEKSSDEQREEAIDVEDDEEEDVMEETQTTAQPVATTTAPPQQPYYAPPPPQYYYPQQQQQPQYYYPPPQQQGITLRDIAALASSPAVAKIIDKVANNKSEDPLMGLVYQYMVKAFTDKLEKSDRYEEAFLNLAEKLTSAFSTNSSKAYSKGLEEYYKQLGRAKGSKDAEKIVKSDEEEQQQVDPLTALFYEMQSLKRDVRKLRGKKKGKAKKMTENAPSEQTESAPPQEQTQNITTSEKKKQPGVFIE